MIKKKNGGRQKENKETVLMFLRWGRKCDHFLWEETDGHCKTSPPPWIFLTNKYIILGQKRYG